MLSVSERGPSASSTVSATSVVSDTSTARSHRSTRTHRSNLSMLIDELSREVFSGSDEISISEDSRTTSGAEQKIGTWTKVLNVLKAIGTVCQVTCPPVPASIVRKVAFHPPAKDSGYRLRLDSEPHRYAASAKEVAGKPFKLVPTPMRGLTHADYAHLMERISTTTIKNSEGHDLVVIHVRARLPDTCESMRKQIVLMTQPNSSDLGHFLQPHCINFLHVADSIGTDLYAFDYSGFGYSGGYPSERHIYTDTMAVFDYVHAKNPDLSIVMLGYSIGTAAAVDLAYRKTVDVPANTSTPALSGMILVAPFTSAIRLLSAQPAREATCCLDVFANSEKISRIDLPILIVHGTDDSMIPMEHSTALAQRLRQPLAPFIVQGADHQTVFGANPNTFQRMAAFVHSETLVGRRFVNSQPVARSVGNLALSTSAKQLVPGAEVIRRLPSTVGSESEPPSATMSVLTLSATPKPAKEPTAPARSKEAETPLKTALEEPSLKTAVRAATPLFTAREAEARPSVESAYYPAATPTNIAEIEIMQSKVASIA